MTLNTFYMLMTAAPMIVLHASPMQHMQRRVLVFLSLHLLPLLDLLISVSAFIAYPDIQPETWELCVAPSSSSPFYLPSLPIQSFTCSVHSIPKGDLKSIHLAISTATNLV